MRIGKQKLRQRLDRQDSHFRVTHRRILAEVVDVRINSLRHERISKGFIVIGAQERLIEVELCTQMMESV